MNNQDPARQAERSELRKITPMKPLKRRLFFVLGLTGVLVLGITWAFATPVGSAADDPFHLSFIWCSFGESESCTLSKDGGFEVPALVGESPCFALDAGKSAACQSHEQAKFVPAATVDGYNPPLFYNTMRLFVGPDVKSSVIVMRMTNVFLAVSLWGLAFAVASRRTRQALVISWLVLITPVGLFFIPSTNPSSWAIIGAGLFWAFLLVLFQLDEQSRLRRYSAVAGAIVTVVIALGSRTDTAFALGVSLIAVTFISMSQARRSSKKIFVLAAVAAAALVIAVLNSRIGGLARAFLQNFQVPSNQGNDQPNAILKLLLEFPAFVGGLIGLQAPGWTQRTSASDAEMAGYSFTGFTFGVGWTDVLMPASVGIILLALLGFVVSEITRDMDVRGVVLLLFLAGSLAGLIIFVRAGTGFSIGNTQPRYYLPLLLASLGILLSQSRISLTRLQLGGLISAATIASALALRATLGRYVHGQAHSFTNLDSGAGWWWPGFSIGPNGLWMFSVGAASIVGLAVWLLAQDAGNADMHVDARSNRLS